MFLKKFNPFKNDIIFIDGLWGTGKSVLSPIVSGMERVEKVKFEHIYEYICVLRYLEKISSDAASWMLNTYADLSQYNNLVGREVNLRWRDDSGFLNNPRSLRYLRRLFSKEGDEKISEINDGNVALNIASHILLPIAGPIFETYDHRAKVVEVVRHPLYMVSHWYTYLKRFDSPREFTPSFHYKGHKVPWFVKGWEDEFVEMNLMDKVLSSLIKLQEWVENAQLETVHKGYHVLTLSFETLVMAPHEALKNLELFLSRKHYHSLSAILRKQKIPRKTISQGKGHAIYGWIKDSRSSEFDIYSRQMDLIKKEGSSSIVSQFLTLIAAYNKKYPSILTHYYDRLP